MADALQNLRLAWRELKKAKQSAERAQVYRGSLGFNTRKQVDNVSDTMRHTSEQIESAMRLVKAAAEGIERANKCLGQSSKSKR